MNISNLEAMINSKIELHNSLTEKFDELAEKKRNLENEMIQVEKQIIHNQGSIQALNELAHAMSQEVSTETVPAEMVDIVE